MIGFNDFDVVCSAGVINACRAQKINRKAARMPPVYTVLGIDEFEDKVLTCWRAVGLERDFWVLIRVTPFVGSIKTSFIV